MNESAKSSSRRAHLAWLHVGVWHKPSTCWWNRVKLDSMLTDTVRPSWILPRGATVALTSLATKTLCIHQLASTQRKECQPFKLLPSHGGIKTGSQRRHADSEGLSQQRETSCDIELQTLKSSVSVKRTMKSDTCWEAEGKLHRSQLQLSSEASCVWCLCRSSCICETLQRRCRWAFSSPPGGAAPGAPKQGDISESRLERTFPGLLRFTGVGADGRVPSGLCKETFAAEPGARWGRFTSPDWDLYSLVS